MTDVERQQVYTAETAALAGTPFDDAPPPGSSGAAFATVFESRWWGAVGAPPPSVRLIGPHERGAFRPATNTITVGRHATWLTMAHEVAHALRHHLPPARTARSRSSSPAPHDLVYRACEGVVFDAVFGAEVGAELRRAFERFGLEIADLGCDVPGPPPVPLWFTDTWRVERGGWRPDRRRRSPVPSAEASRRTSPAQRTRTL